MSVDLLSRLKPLRRPAIVAFYLAVLALCAWAIRSAFKNKGPGDVLDALLAIPTSTLWMAIGLVGAIYAVLCVVEYLAHRDAGVKVSLRRVIFSGLVGNAIAIGAGLGPVSGGAVRARLFSAWGQSPAAGTLVAAVVTMTSLSGGALLASAGVVIHPAPLAATIGVPTLLPRLVGVIAIAVIAAALVGAGFLKGARRLFGIESQVPGARGAALRLSLGAFDWLLSASVLYILLPESTHGPFFAFAAVFAAAHFAGMAAGTPSGLGVFDAIMLNVAPTKATADQLAAALLLYRLIAFFMPLGLAVFSLAVYEGRIAFRRRKR